MLLALDTSTSAVTVALVDGSTVLAERTVDGAQHHGEALAPLVTDVLAAAGLPPAALTLVAVGVGPGPFTGLRVGMVTGVALGAALGIEVVGVCSLDALAVPGEDVLALTDARRKEVYWARYVDGAQVVGPQVSRPQDLVDLLPDGPSVLLGPGAELYADTFAGAGLTVRRGAAVRASVLAARVLAGHTVPVTPLYLRRPDAVAPVGAGRKATLQGAGPTAPGAGGRG